MLKHSLAILVFDTTTATLTKRINLMTNLKVQVLTNEDLAREKRGLTVAERLRSCRFGFIDETVDPGDQDALSFPQQIIMFVRNFRGYKQGQRGRRNECMGMNGMVIQNWPDFVPFDEVDDFCAALKELRDAGVAEMTRAH
jgi:hypothetical protein